ncbi:Hypothetical protein LUCI_4628 [Lucifera butyrica]|uniref:Uncharacterized protein n=1 Tax=Lucifera butyrica TaxID=1351585 RepID=A0A498RJY0_9FIRM|nr:hypothetical protein [Lucifera butyrica]VBB09338.1 Hypothetical protein LUCI_4628 [Lucifera butyrica]
MVNTNTPDLTQWKALYELATEFNRARCWDWMDDYEIFGVRDPESGLIYYCSIMGASAEHFGIAAYRDVHGLYLLNKILSNDMPDFPPDFSYEQDCLSCSFEDRNMLLKEELQTIKNLGLKFRGRNQWPSFQDYTPGLLPWFLTGDQCRTMQHILRQALQVAGRCRENKKILLGKNNTLLVRTPSQGNDGTLEWKDRYVQPQKYVIESGEFTSQNDVLIQKLRRLKIDKCFELEADIFYAPAPVGDKGQRPYFPTMGVILDRKSGLLLGAEMVRDLKTEGHIFLSYLVDTILKPNKKPGCLYVARPEAYILFNGFCEQIGLPLKIVDHLEFVNEFRTSLEEQMHRE